MIVLLRIDLKKPKKRDIEILTALALHLRGRAGRRAREAFLTLAGDYIPTDSAQSEAEPPEPADCPSG